MLELRHVAHVTTGVSARTTGIHPRRAWSRAFCALLAAGLLVPPAACADSSARVPTSHNLWPFGILMWGGACGAFMLALKLARSVLRAA